MRTTNATVTELIDHGSVKAHQVLVVALCLIFNMVDGFDITAMAVTAHQIGEEMQLGPEKIGLIFSFSLAGMMMGAMFLASLSDVVGRRMMIIVSLTLVGATVAVTPLAESLPTLILLRFISGLGAGAMLASVATLAAEYSPERYRALSVTAVTAGYPLGAMMTGIVASSIVPEFGWRGMFYTGGVVTLVLAGVAALVIPESLQFLCNRRPAGALVKINRILERFNAEAVQDIPVLESAPHSHQRQSIAQKMFSLLTPALRKNTLILWAAFFLCISTLYFLMSWTPKIMINLGFSVEVGNQAFTLYNFGGVLGIISLGWLASRWSLSILISLFTVASGVLMWVFAATATVAPAEAGLLALIFLIGFSLQGGYTGMYAVAAKLYPIDIRSTGVGWAIGLGRFGAVIGPGIAGYMIASGLSITTNFLIFAVPMLVGGFLAYQLKIR